MGPEWRRELLQVMSGGRVELCVPAAYKSGDGGSDAIRYRSPPGEDTLEG